MQAIQVPNWLSLVFFGLVFQNNVAEMGSTPWHMCVAQRGLGGARRVVWGKTKEVKQGLSHIFNFLSFLVSTGTVPVSLSENTVLLPRCDPISQSFSELSSKGLSVI